MIAEARKALNAPEGTFDRLEIFRPLSGAGTVVHEVTILYPEGDKGVARFDSVGKLVGTEVPESRRPADEKTLDAIYERAILALARDYGKEVRIVTIDLRDDGRGFFTIEDPKKPGEMIDIMMSAAGGFEPFGWVSPDKSLDNAFEIKDFIHINRLGIKNASASVLKTFGRTRFVSSG